MWSLIITSPKSKPLRIKLASGKMMIGRLVTSDIVVNDTAASRRHAEIYYDSLTDVLSINDLKSSNGTYVNRQRISGFYRLHDGDIIRIGQTEMHLGNITDAGSGQKDISGTTLLSRGLVLEAVDENPILLNEVTEELNTVVDKDSTAKLVIDTIKRTMGVDVCEIVLAADFKKIDLGNPDNLMARAIRNSSVEISPLALCVPVISGGKPYALIYLEKNSPEARPFDKREMQMVVGISHQTALAMQRIELLEKIRKEGQVKQLLLKFISPIEAEQELKDYLKTGNLPGLAEKRVTVLFAEIVETPGLLERTGLKEFSTHLNTFYQRVTQIVFKNGGMVRYLGDGVLAFFMEVEDRLGQEERAAIVACEVMESVRRVEHEPDRPCMVGIAINTGKAMAGYVGSQERAEFNVLGNLIRVTYRMQEYAQPNRIFVGASTAQAIRNRYRLENAGSLTIKGSGQPIQVYGLSDMKTAPFVQDVKNSDLPSAFKAVAEKFKKFNK